MEDMDIEPGMRVEVTTASGERVVMRALSSETDGRDMRIVWVCTEQEFEQAGADAYRLPWPADAVRALETA